MVWLCDISHPDFLYFQMYLKKKHACNGCSASFKFKQDLYRHNRSSHLGIMINCPLCIKKFTQKSSMKTHVQNAICVVVCLDTSLILILDHSQPQFLIKHFLIKKNECNKNSVSICDG